MRDHFEQHIPQAREALDRLTDGTAPAELLYPHATELANAHGGLVMDAVPSIALDGSAEPTARLMREHGLRADPHRIVIWTELSWAVMVAYEDLHDGFTTRTVAITVRVEEDLETGSVDMAYCDRFGPGGATGRFLQRRARALGMAHLPF